MIGVLVRSDQIHPDEDELFSCQVSTIGISTSLLRQVAIALHCIMASCRIPALYCLPGNSANVPVAAP
jgi:hypothetical protein